MTDLDFLGPPGFRYSERERRAILALCAPLHNSSANDGDSDAAASCVGQFEAAACHTITMYQKHPQWSQREAERYWEDRYWADMERHADSLVTLIRMWDWDYAVEGGPPIPSDDLEDLVWFARDMQSSGKSPRVHDFPRQDFGFSVLDRYVLETRRQPSAASNARAVRLLQAAVNPVMVHARRKLGLQMVRPLAVEHARYLIRHWKADKGEKPALRG